MYQVGAGLALVVLALLAVALVAMSAGSMIERLWRLFDPEAQEIARQELAATSAARIATAKAMLWLGVASRWGWESA